MSAVSPFPLQQAETQAAQVVVADLSGQSPEQADLLPFFLARCLDYPRELEELYELLWRPGSTR